MRYNQRQSPNGSEDEYVTAYADTTPGPARLEPAIAIVTFAAFCAVVLTVAPLLIGPDGDAYRASIVAITDGHLLSLSAKQAHQLAAQLARCPTTATACLTPGLAGGLGRALEQWVRLPGGRWISEKNPGYPFLAAPFQALGLIRLTPLCYGGLACLSLYAGARRWLGRPGGAIAVGLFCSCDLAMFFAWQDYWASYTDTALIAAGTGTLLWAALADDVPMRRRAWAGLFGFMAIEAAVFIRYTDVVVLGCAVVTVLVLDRLRPGDLPRRAVSCWIGSAALLAAGIALFDDLAYGGPFRTGYRSGEITFSLNAIGPNLRYMPGHLVEAMPVLVLGTAGLALAVARWTRRGHNAAAGSHERRDVRVALAIAAPWLAVWGLYSAYAWTAQPGIGTWQSARFYLPAIGPIALLGAFFLVRLRQQLNPPSRAWLHTAPAAALVAIFFALSCLTFHHQLAQATPGTAPPHCNIGEPHCHAAPRQGRQDAATGAVVPAVGWRSNLRRMRRQASAN